MRYKKYQETKKYWSNIYRKITFSFIYYVIPAVSHLNVTKMSNPFSGFLSLGITDALSQIIFAVGVILCVVRSLWCPPSLLQSGQEHPLPPALITKMSPENANVHWR